MIGFQAVGEAVKGAVEGVPDIVWNALVAAGGITAVYFIGRKIVNRQKVISASNHVGEDSKLGLATEYANLLHDAMERLKWLPWDGTDEAQMLQVAEAMYTHGIPFSQVAKVYRKLFSSDLITDIDEELSGEDKQKFFALLRGGLQGVKAWLY